MLVASLWLTEMDGRYARLRGKSWVPQNLRETKRLDAYVVLKHVSFILSGCPIDTRQQCPSRSVCRLWKQLRVACVGSEKHRPPGVNSAQAWLSLSRRIRSIDCCLHSCHFGSALRALASRRSKTLLPKERPCCQPQEDGALGLFYKSQENFSEKTAGIFVRD